MTDLVNDVFDIVVPRFLRVVGAGFAATLVFTLVAYYVAPMMTGFHMDVAAYFAGKLGGNSMLGAMLHYIAGTIAFPLGYLVVESRLPGPPMVKGAIGGSSCGSVPCWWCSRRPGPVFSC
jgi:hypothetical protein